MSFITTFFSYSTHTGHESVQRHFVCTSKVSAGYSSVDTSFCDNKVHLEHLVSLLKNAASDSSAIVKSITIKGCASPEGYTPMNRKLSEKRAQNVRTYILNKTHLTDSIIKVLPSDVDWELLSKMIATTEQPWRNEAIES